MSDSVEPRAAAIASVLDDVRRHLESGLAAGHYEMSLTVRALGEGAREIIVNGSPSRRFKIPAARMPLFET